MGTIGDDGVGGGLSAESGYWPERAPYANRVSPGSRGRLKEYRPELPSMRAPLGIGAETVMLGGPDAWTGSPERDL
jgi:hypothetical protein